MHFPLTPLTTTQLQLLEQLMRAELPHPDAEPTAAAACGLDEEQLRLDVRDLAWAGLVSQDNGTLSITMSGAATFYSAEYEAASALLVDVVSFTDEMEQRRFPTRESHALRQLAQGVWSLGKAMAYLDEADSDEDRS